MWKSKFSKNKLFVALPNNKKSLEKAVNRWFDEDDEDDDEEAT